MANQLNLATSFVTGDTVSAASLNNLINTTTVNAAIIKNQNEITTIGTADLLLIAPENVEPSLAPRKVTVQNLLDDGLTAGTFTSFNLTGALTYGTATGNRTVSTSATITTGTIPNLTSSTANITLGTISTLTAGTTTSTAANITNGTVQTLTASTATITTGTVSTLNSTTGTITNLSTTLAGDFTISQGTGTLGTTGATLGTYGGSTSIPVLAIDAKGRVTTASTSAITSGLTGFRNRIINGDMRIDQRNAGASVTPTNNQYLVDRFAATLTQASKFTAQQNAGAVTPPTGFTNYLGITSSSSYSVLVGDTFAILQYIEGFNTADLAWGTASASTITLSFQVYSSLTGTFGGALTNNAQNRSYPFSYTISSVNTWTKITITIAGDTSGTWLSDNSTGIGIRFGLGSGSTYSGTSGAWAAGNFIQPTSTVSVVGTSGATFYITGVQLEAGSTATDFERRPIGTELALCQRYCQITKGGNGCWTSSTACQINLHQNVEMRSAPSLSQTGVLTLTDYVGSDYTQSSPSISILNTNTKYSTTTLLSNFSGATTGRIAGIRPYSAYDGYILMTSEL